MKKVLVLLMASTLVAGGCAAPQTKTGKGALIGTGVGAAAGAGLGQAIGGDTEATLIGAGIGALVGGLAGGSIGRYMDNQEAAMRQQLAYTESASVQRQAETLAVTFKSDLLFDVGSSAIKPGGLDELNRVAQVLNQYPQTTILIAGHTDSTGAEDMNQRLSEQRAQSVKNSLMGQGVDATRMNTIGFGETKPVADNNTQAGQQLNRRVEITITPNQGAGAAQG
jgi:outer membrane protein OmpA-like peptidoglycan-associated protein